MPTISTPSDGGNDAGFNFIASGVLVVMATGSATSETSEGVVSSYSNDTIVNAGIIAGLNGIYNTGDNLILTNAAGGVISGQQGINTSGDNNSITNMGTIIGSTAADTHDSVYAGIRLFISDHNNNVTNYGTISGYDGVFENAAVNATVTNYGTIQGSEASITSAGNAFWSGGYGLTIHNNGLLQGDVLFGNLSSISPDGTIASTNLFDGDGGTVHGNIMGGTGNDTFDLSHQTVTGTVTGGGGFDTIAFASGAGAFAVDLGDGTAYGAGEAFTFSGIENATGSAYADTINGDDNANIVNGGAGNDTINGNGGADVINAGPGVDTVMAGPGNDVVNGNGGADILYGNGGADVIAGGAGADTLTGGAGNDTFVYNLVTDSPTTGPDLITDFTHGSDKIDLTALHLANAGDVTITSSNGLTYLHIDVNNDGTVDMLINLTGTNALTASDILGIPGAAPATHAVSTTDAAATTIAHHDLATSLHAVATDHGLYG